MNEDTESAMIKTMLSLFLLFDDSFDEFVNWDVVGMDEDEVMQKNELQIEVVGADDEEDDETRDDVEENGSCEDEIIEVVWGVFGVTWLLVIEDVVTTITKSNVNITWWL